jgi:hypothetical protein
MINSKTIAALTVLSLVASWGCESSPVVAPADGELFLSANPATITLDEFAVPPVPTASIVISAQLLSVNGVPQSGVSVVFSSDAGALASAPVGQPITPKNTDDNGFVSDTLTVQLGDPDSITVTARSGSLTQSIAINKTEVLPNQPPLAAFDISPSGTAVLGQTVFYNASSTIDPDGDPITCYQWEFLTSENIDSPQIECESQSSRCEVLQGRLNVSREYDVEQARVDVTLRVSDDPSIACPPGGPAEPSASFNASVTETHDVVCDRSMPVANAGPLARSVTLSGSPLMASLLFNAGNSNGGDTGIQSYDWDCGNGTVVTGGPVSLSCTYTAAGSYTVVLVVTNGCGMSDSAFVAVTVN